MNLFTHSTIFNVLISGDISLKKTESITSWRSELRIPKPLIKQLSTIYLMDEVIDEIGGSIIIFYKGH